MKTKIFRRLFAILFLISFGTNAALAEEMAEENILITDGSDYDELVDGAVDAVKQMWTEEIYGDLLKDKNPKCMGYLEIKNTRIVFLQDEFGQRDRLSDEEIIEAMEDYTGQIEEAPDSGEEYYVETGKKVDTLGRLNANISNELAGAACIIEFDLYSDIYGYAPYYFPTRMCDNVVVYTDGTNKVRYDNPIETLICSYWSNEYYEEDLSWLVKSVEDLEGAYNQSFELNKE